MFNKQKHYLLCLELEGQSLYRVESDKEQFPLTIGRDASCDWRIPAIDRTASNRHAELFYKRGKLFIRDLESHNGVMRFDEKIKEHAIAIGDSYSIGDCKLTVLAPSRAQDGSAEVRHHELEQLNGRHPKTTILDKSEYIIGSDGQADIVCQDSMVSHRHAKLTIKPDGSCWISDLGSRNGTAVNQVRLSTEQEDGRMLQDGDIISIVWVNYRFWDKNSRNKKMHLVLKSVIALATALILLFGYFLVQTMDRTAKEYLGLAQDYAKAEKFDQALAYLKKASEARHWDSVRKECSAYQRDIEEWKKIRKSWNATDANLKKGNLDAAGMPLASLLQRQKLWNWNDSSALETRRQAKNAWQILEPTFQGRNLLKRTSLERDELSRQIAVLKKSMETPTEAYPLLMKEANKVCSELVYTQEHLNDIEKIVNSLSSKKDVRSLVAELKAMQVEMEDRRKKNGMARLVSVVPIDLCKTYLEPMECFAIAQDEYRQNLRNAASLQFQRQTLRLSLPSAALCKYSPVFSTVSSEFEVLNNQLQQAVTGLEQTCRMLAEQGIQLNKTSAIMQEFQAPDFLKKLTGFDCLAYGNLKASRNAPSGYYDRFLGVEVFYHFIRCLPEDFDSQILQNASFTPEIFKLKEQYDAMDIFKKMMDSYVAVPAILENEVKGASLQDFFLWIDGLLDARDAAIRRCMDYSRQRAKEKARDSLVAGGVALLLRPDNYTGFAEDYSRLARLHKQLRRQMEELSSGEHSLAELKQIQEQILAMGLPGDHLLRKILRERAEAKNEH